MLKESVRSCLLGLAAALLLTGFAFGTPGAPLVTAGVLHTCSLDAFGVVKCWGWNAYGQLGVAIGQDSIGSPVRVSSLGSGVKQVSAGFMHTCAIKWTGQAVCWGSNPYGQLGNGSLQGSLAPTAVQGLEDAVINISTGYDYSCAVKSGGTVWCWGANARGQLGTGNTADSVLPVQVSGISGSARSVVASYYSTCAVTTAQSVVCWGYGNPGLGSLTPSAVTGFSAPVIKLAASQSEYCALLSTGSVQCWQTGSAPAVVIGLEHNVVDVALGSQHGCAILTTGEVKCWGYGGEGEVGDVSNAYRVPLSLVNGTPPGIVSIAAGSSHTCVQTVYGAVKCWGNNVKNQLGQGLEQPAYFAPVRVSGGIGSKTSLAAAPRVACAIDTIAGAVCWGANYFGQLGDGTTVHRWIPSTVQHTAGQLTRLASSGSHSCGITTSSSVACWGSNFASQLGDGTKIERLVPVAVDGGLTNMHDIGAGFYHSCASDAASVYCWGGANGLGLLGTGALDTSNAPVHVPGISGAVSSLSVASQYTCIVANGGVNCWGQNAVGQLGIGTTEGSNVPVVPVGLGVGVRQVITGRSHACAQLVTNDWKCWGANYAGQLGDGTTTQRLSPVPATTIPTGTTGLALGTAHTCALMQGGGVKCWGDNSGGQLGTGSIVFGSMAPLDVLGLNSGVVGIAAGDSNTCALQADGAALCWGGNGSGQSGAGTAGYRPIPSLFVPELNVLGEIQVLVAPVAPITTQPTTISATLPGSSNSGTVQFTLLNTVLTGCAAVPVVNGMATCQLVAPSPGDYSVTVTYSGDANHPALAATSGFQSTGALVSALTVGAATVVRSDRSFSVAVHVTGQSGTPSGTVTVTAAGSTCTITLRTAVEQCMIAPMTLGLNQPVVVSYSGDANFQAAVQQSAISVVTALDVNASGSHDATTDGILVMRYLFGYRGAGLVAGIPSAGSVRFSPTDIESYLNTTFYDLDADLDGRVLPLTDGLLVLRFLLGLRGDALIHGAVGPVAFRTSASAIATYLTQFTQ